MSTSDAPVFTLEAVNALVPRLSELVGRQLGRRADIESRLTALCELTGDSPDNLAARETDAPPVLALKRELGERVEQYQAGWREIEEMGAVLKDPRVGLIDFYGRVEGKLVWLCWKYPEQEVSHYHALDEGFAARKAIGEGVKQRLLN
jgi:hypothetical protein